MFAALLGALHLVADGPMPPPRFPIDRVCDVRSRGWRADGPPNPAGRSLCIQQEQDAYDGVRAVWRSLDPDIQERCVKLARPSSSYVALASCVYQLLPTQDARRSRSFQY